MSVKQRRLSVSFTLALFRSSARSVFKTYPNLSSSIFSITTTRCQATIISHLPPCFNSRPGTAACLSPSISLACWKPPSSFASLSPWEDSKGLTIRLQLLPSLTLLSFPACPTPSTLLSPSSLNSPGMNLPQHLLFCSSRRHLLFPLSEIRSPQPEVLLPFDLCLSTSS